MDHEIPGKNISPFLRKVDLCKALAFTGQCCELCWVTAGKLGGGVPVTMSNRVPGKCKTRGPHQCSASGTGTAQGGGTSCRATKDELKLGELVMHDAPCTWGQVPGKHPESHKEVPL